MKSIITNLRTIAALSVIAFSVACTRETNTPAPGNNNVADKTEMENLVVSPSFNFETNKRVNFRLTTRRPNGEIMKARKIQIFDANPITNPNANILAVGPADATGIFEGVMQVPNHIKKLYIKSNCIGLVDVVAFDVATAGSLYEKSLVPTENYDNGLDDEAISANGNRSGASGPVLTYMGTFNSLGVPNYLTPTNDVIPAGLMADVSNSLPEAQSVWNHHPAYVNTSAQTNIHLTDSADIWITFLHEGAGFKNGLGYFTYNKNTPPTSKSQITEHKIVFPNTSYSGSGGGLVTGNRIFLGRFPANTGIGWFVAPNGWNGSGVTSSTNFLYSFDEFNPEPVPAQRPHFVFLKDLGRQRFVLALEDVQYSGSDKDFNDCVYMVTINPLSNVDITDVEDLDRIIVDDDGDGIPDGDDEYPTDPKRAYNCQCACGPNFQSLAFEDLWPSKGDYDYNDLVMDYKYRMVTNAQTKVVDIIGQYKIRSIGASYHNGFGVTFNVSPGVVESVTGTSIVGTNNATTFSANGTEAGQMFATAILTNDLWRKVGNPAGNVFHNTLMAEPRGTSDTMTMKVTFGTPQNLAALGSDPFNPFIYRVIPSGPDAGKRTEVHLSGKQPSSKATASFFNTKDDNTVPASFRYYKTASNLPFAIHIPVSFAYPTEKSQITKTHLKFAAWAESNGLLFGDWYLNESGYRDNSKIFIY